MSDKQTVDNSRVEAAELTLPAWQSEASAHRGNRQEDTPTVAGSRTEVTGRAAPTWWLVFVRELIDLWIGGKALILIFLFSILLGVMTYVLASNSELSLIPPKEMVFLTLQAAIAVGLFIGVIIGADSISGERERATLEALLLTPTSRRQIVAGKFLAAMSPWPAAMLITIPYLKVLSQGDEVFGQAMFWGVLLGTLLIPAFTGFGMLASIWSNSNKTSLFVSLVVYLLCLLPTQFPGSAQTGTMGRLLKTVNPMEAINHFLEKILVNNRTLAELQVFLRAPVLFAAIVLGLLFLYAAPRLHLDGGIPSPTRSKRGRTAALVIMLGLMGSLTAPAALASPAAQPASPPSPLAVSIDMDYAVVKNGDPIFFTTVVTNNGAEESAPLTLAMNIINLNAEGDVVDPEDWSPERTQYLEALAPGASATHSWRVNTILEGDYMVYMVVIPQPEGQEVTSQPVASSGIHITVEKFVRINPGGVLPYAIGGPVILLLGVFLVYRMRRRGIDVGSDS